MNLKELLILPLTAALIGCGGGEANVTEEQTSENTAIKAKADASVPGEGVSNPNLAKSEKAEDAPPGARMASKPADTGLGGFGAPDAITGESKTSLQALQDAVTIYDRMRATSVLEPNQKVWPKLTSLEDLVTVRLISRIPDGPDGKKWSLNTDKMAVELK